jgi:hypothetical protein
MGMATLATAQAAYLDNADYDENASVSQAKAFRTACRQLIVLLPSNAMRGAGSNQQTASFRIDEVRKQLEACECWLAVNDTTGSPGVVHPDFAYSRD